MLKLNILNMKNFLSTVDACEDAVYLICEDGNKENINKCRYAQNFLKHDYEHNQNSLKIKLQIPNPHDYFKIVTYYTGDC